MHCQDKFLLTIIMLDGCQPKYGRFLLIQGSVCLNWMSSQGNDGVRVEVGTGVLTV